MRALLLLIPVAVHAGQSVDSRLTEKLQSEYEEFKLPSAQLERGRALYHAGHANGSCDDAAIGATLIALAWASAPGKTYPKEVSTLEMPPGCAPALPNLPYQIGAAAFVHRAYAEAAVQFEKAATYDRWEVPAYTALGACQQQLGNLEAAAEAYKQAVQSSKKVVSPLLLNNLASLYLLMRQGKEALEVAERGRGVWADGTDWVAQGFHPDLGHMLEHNILAAAVLCNDTAKARSTYVAMEREILGKPDFLLTSVLYALFHEEHAAFEIAFNAQAPVAELSLPDDYALLLPTSWPIAWESNGNAQEHAWAYLVAAKRFGMLADFVTIPDNERSSDPFVGYALRHGRTALWGLLLCTLAVAAWLAVRHMREGRRRVEAGADPVEEDLVSALAALRTQIVAGTVAHGWTDRLARARAGTLAADEPSPQASLGLTSLEWEILEMSARGIEAKAIAATVNRTPGHVLNVRSALRKRLEIDPSETFSAWWKRSGMPTLLLAVLSITGFSATRAAVYPEWVRALHASDTASAGREAEIWLAQRAESSPDLEGIGLFSQTVLLTGTVAQWEAIRPACEATIAEDTAAAAALLGPLRVLYAPWRTALLEEASAIAGEPVAELTPAGWWLLVTPAAAADRRSPGEILAALPELKVLRNWWIYIGLRKLRFLFGAWLVALAGLAILATRMRRSRKTTPPPGTSYNRAGLSSLTPLIAAANSGKPLSLQLALWEACAFESGTSRLSLSPYLPATWSALSAREQLLLHLLFHRVSAADCAAVLARTERTIYTMRSTIRAKLGLASGASLEHEMARWVG